MTRTRLPELVVPGRRLGRHVRHDRRSLDYLLPTTTAYRSISWPRHTPILDQGDLGSCTGNALAAALGTGPLWDALADALDELESPFPALDELFAVGVYSDAEKLDGGPGYPPEDEGSSGLSVAKVAKARRLIAGYRHATSVGAAHTAIQAGPFIIGTVWLSGMDEPGADGLVQPVGNVRGGHEYLCREYDALADLWWFDNSWGPSWGVAGRFAYSSATLAALLGEQGDITALVPLTAPTPQPSPAGVTLSFNAADTAALDLFGAHRHSSPYLVAAAQAWNRARA